jgi:2-aminoadipate transaminase
MGVNYLFLGRFVPQKRYNYPYVAMNFEFHSKLVLTLTMYLPKKILKMDPQFSDRISDVPRSFIREILKDALMPDVISFAGGLPNRNLFPLAEIEHAASRVLTEFGADALQYAPSEGFLPLRKFIADSYQARDMKINPDDILITNGSQQGLDLIGKVMINEGDTVVVEEPGYLGAIQAFSLYRPKFAPVELAEKGMNAEQLRDILKNQKVRIIYSVPNFQNPSGITHPESNRREIADILNEYKTLLIEDDPYGEIRFSGTPVSSFYCFAPEKTIMLGSFSKIIVPGFRIGWIVAPPALMEKLIIAKQASDLHTTQYLQCLIYIYLRDNDYKAHIRKISEVYGRQKNVMAGAISKYFPSDVKFTNPEGGMFLWVTLPEEISAMDLFTVSAREKVIFVPGDPFYTNRKDVNTLRLNFSCSDEETINEGIRRMGRAIEKLEMKAK